MVIGCLARFRELLQFVIVLSSLLIVLSSLLDASMFVLQEFIAKPSVAVLFKLTKAQWVELATHYGLQFNPSLKKDEIKEKVLGYMVQEEIFSEVEVEMLQHPSQLIALRQIELDEKRLEVEKLKADNERLRLTRNLSTVGDTGCFKIEVALKFVPKFNEDDPEGFFTHFEKSAGLHSWPQDKWVLLINNSLTGRAQEVFSALDDSQIEDYEFVKKKNCTACLRESS